MSDIQMNPASSTVASTPPPGPVEPMLFKLYVGEWAKNQKKTNDKMQSLEDINTKLNQLNSLLAKLGTLQTQVGENGDAEKLKKALEKDTNLIYAINQDIKQAELPEPLFPNSEGSASYKWDKYEPKVTEISKFAPSLGVQVLKDLGNRDWPAVQFLFQNQLNQSPAKFDGITKEEWEALASKLLPTVPDGANRMDVPPPSPFNGAAGSMGWGLAVFHNVRRDYALQFNEAQDSRVPGGLNNSRTGSDLYGAVQRVKAEISNLSNRLQSATSAVNQSMQVTTAIMSAITDITQKMFDAKSKALS